MKKKLIAGLFLATMVFSLVACDYGRDKDASEENTKKVVDNTLSEKEISTELSETEEKEIEKEREIDVKNWTQAYIDLLQVIYGDENKFGFAYLNDDDIPEIIWFCEDVEEFGFSDYNIFSYYNGKVYREHPYAACGNITYIEKQNKLLSSENVSSYQGNSYRFDEIYNLKFDCLVDDEDTDKCISSSLAAGYYYKDSECKWNNQTMSTEQYEKELNAVFDVSIAKSVHTIYDVDGMISALKTLQNSYNNDLPKWKQAYLNYIVMSIDSSYFDYMKYSLVNIDGDNIPELACISSETAIGMFLLVYYDGEIFELHFSTGGLYCIENENKCLLSSGRMDVYEDSIFHLEKGKYIEDNSGHYGLKDNSVIVDESGNPIPYSYHWNNKEVSEQEYNNLLEKAFDKSKATNVNAEYDKKAIIAILSSNY